jgi:RNA 2',3'-cyclic 3'-phosphodiesterase
MARDRAARPEAKTLRLFLAVDVPDEVRDALASSVAPLRSAIPGARWAPPENWHVTLKFLGSVYPRLSGWVREQAAAAAAESEPFLSAMAGLGAFPSPRRARVLWAGLDDPEGRLTALAGSLDHLLEREFPPEQRPFSAHLTVARMREQVALEPSVLQTLVPSEPFEIHELVLYRSHLGRPHARYEPIQRIRLGGDAGGQSPARDRSRGLAPKRQAS